MIRQIVSVIAGYLIFAVSSVMLFNLTGQQPHEDAPMSFKLITIAYGAVFSMLAGFTVQWIAGQRVLTLNYILAAIMFVLAATSLFLSSGSHWTQLFAMFIFAPVSVLGGYLKRKGK